MTERGIRAFTQYLEAVWMYDIGKHPYRATADPKS